MGSYFVVIDVCRDLAAGISVDRPFVKIKIGPKCFRLKAAVETLNQGPAPFLAGQLPTSAIGRCTFLSHDWPTAAFITYQNSGPNRLLAAFFVAALFISQRPGEHAILHVAVQTLQSKPSVSLL